MRRTESADNKLIIVVSDEYTPLDKRHPVFDAYHDKSYIISHDCRKIVSLSEKGENRVYRLMNDSNHELVVMRVDGGIFNDSSSIKCDYAIYSQERILILVELKGSDYLHALEQIAATINEMVTKRQLKLSKLHARVVLSKVRIPNTLISKEMALKRKLMAHHGTLVKATRLFEEKLSDL